MGANNNETVTDFCARVRNRRRCRSQQNCNTIVLPTDGCCPICGKSLLKQPKFEFFPFIGGGVTVGIDKDALEWYSEEFDDARTTSEIRRRMTDSDIVRETSGKCNVEAQFASNGNAT